MSRSNNSQSNQQRGSNHKTNGGSNHKTNGGSNYQGKPQTNNKVACCPHCSNLNKYNETVLPTNHFLRETPSPDSKLTCPVLLATECRYCKGFGHTVSRCPLAASENKRRENELESRKRAASALLEQTAKSKLKPKSTNSFGALDSDSDEEKPTRAKSVNTKRRHMSETPTAIKIFDFPTLPNRSVTTEKPILVQMNFMEAITKEPEPEVIKHVAVLPPMLQTIPVQSKFATFYQAKPKWAESDSDDEDTASDLQRKEDEYAAVQQSQIMDIALAQSIDIDGYTTNAHLYSTSTVDSW